MNTLVDQTINRLVSSYSDDILRRLIKAAGQKLKKENQYKIVINISFISLFRDFNQTYTINQYVEETEIVIKFLIKLVENFDIFDDVSLWPNMQILILEIGYSLFEPGEIRSLTTYLDFLKYFLQKIFHNKEDDTRPYKYISEFLQTNNSNNKEIIQTYIDLISERNDFKYGFNLQDSLKLYEILNEFINENFIPDYFDIERIFHYELAYLYDYVVCYFNPHNEDFESVIIEDKLDINLNPLQLDVEYKVRIYQVNTD